MKKTVYFVFSILIISIFVTFTSCDPSVAKTYPTWFNEYSGETLTTLKAAQDAYECFGTINNRVIIYGSNATPPSPDVTFYEDSTERQYMITFGTRDNSDFIESQDIQPFKDAVLASGFVYDNGSDSYVKENVTINIYVMAIPDDPHFEFMVVETL